MRIAISARHWRHTRVVFVLRYSLPRSGLCPSLSQPEAHLHLAVHRRGGREMFTSFLMPSHASTEPAQTQMAVGDDRAHIQFIGEDYGLPVERFSLLVIRRAAMRCDLAQCPEGPGLVHPSLVATGEIEGLIGEPDRVFFSVGQSIRLAQVNNRLGQVVPMSRQDGLVELIEERQTVGETPGHHIRITQERSNSVEPGRDAPGLAESMAALEDGDRLHEIAFAQIEKPEMSTCSDETEGVVYCLSDPYPFLSPDDPLREIATLDKHVAQSNPGP